MQHMLRGLPKLTRYSALEFGLKALYGNKIASVFFFNSVKQGAMVKMYNKAKLPGWDSRTYG